MPKRRVLDLQLKRAALVDACVRKKRGRHLISVSLIWPRPAISERTAVQSLVFEGGCCDLSSADWSSRILLKETVQGPFAITASITEALSDGQVSRIMKLLGSVMLDVAETEISRAVANPLVEGLLGLPFQRLASLKESGPGILGFGSLDVDPEKRFRSSRSRSLSIPLHAPEEVTCVTRKRRHGQLVSRRKVLLEAGEESGKVELLAKMYD